MVRNPKAVPGRRLTKREVLVLAELASGKTFIEVGDELSMAGTTVKSHLDTIRKKLGARNTLHAVTIALATGIISESLVVAGSVPLDTLRGETGNLGSVTLHRVQFNENVDFFLTEIQLTEFIEYPSRRVWYKLSGWLAKECPPLRTMRRAILSDVSLPYRPCPVGQPVIVQTAKRTNEYTLGVFVELHWPKYGVLE